MTHENCNDKEIAALLKKCDAMLKTRKEQYFDSAEFLFLIDEYSERGVPDKTILQLFNYAEKQHGFTVEIAARKVRFLLDCGREDDALQILLKLVNLEPENPDFFYLMALCYQAQDNAKKAIPLFKDVVRINPYHAEAWFDLGTMYWEIGEYENSIESLNYAIAINPNDELILLLQASCLQNMGKHEEAKEMYHEVLKLNPEQLGALEILADIYFREENIEMSEMYWQKVLDIDSNHAEAWAALARIKALNEDYQTALEMFEKSLQIDPDNTDIAADCAMLLSALDLYKEAVELCFNAVQIDAANTEIWLKFSTILRNAGKPDKAIMVLHDALEYTTDAPIYYTLAELCIAQKKEKKALAYLKKGYAQNPDMAEVFFDTCQLNPEQLKLFHTIIHTEYAKF
ncbi:MAG: tetratricopeptide repeat protein [Bacteroidales bacterium]|jgi:tetratricopeptide (TPR) repeat protein|nr:tetratricopeptide repeat protein [Bacteroidales bacterium]